MYEKPTAQLQRRGTTTHLEILGGINLLVDILLGLDVDGREGGLQRDAVSASKVKVRMLRDLPSCR